MGSKFDSQKFKFKKFPPQKCENCPKFIWNFPKLADLTYADCNFLIRKPPLREENYVGLAL